MTFHDIKTLTLIACTLALGALAGCQGSGGLNATTLSPDAPAPQIGPIELPDFPANDLPGDEPRIVADTDNIQDGRNTWRRSVEGATDQGSALILASGPPPVAWGIWRWGVFTGANVPKSLRFESDVVDESEYWALLSNYATGFWEVYGPLDAALHAHAYDAESAADYISPAGYTYVAVLVEGGDSTVVGGLNLIVTEDDVNPPATPIGLAVVQTRATSIDLSWDANSEPDLDVYNIYSGPTVDFEFDDPGVVDHGDVDSTLSEYTVGGLDPETEYNFRISASDDLGNESPLSNTATGTTTVAGDYPPPSNLAVANIAGSWVEISYDEPTVPTPLGYEFYTGPTPSFEIGQPGVVLRHIGIVNDNPFRMEGLEAETEYHCRARALYLGSNWSDLSDPLTFETIIGTAPSPDFFTIPAFVQVGMLTTFDPSITTDDDTPLESLTFTWDFENDGTPDAETTGPDQVTHTYPDRGEVQCKLTASDGTAVSIVRDITVSFQFDYQQTVAASGEPANVVAVDVNPGDDRIAVLVDVSGAPQVEYYNGSSWQTYYANSIGAEAYSDVALTATSVSIMAVALNGSSEYEWTVYNRSGSSWVADASGSVSTGAYVDGAMDIDSNGRVGVCMYTGEAAVPNIFFYINNWHEKTDSSFNTSRKQTGMNTWSPADVQRNTTTTYVIYPAGGNISQWSLTDSTDSDQSMQSYPVPVPPPAGVYGAMTHITTCLDPDNDTRVSWAATYEEGVNAVPTTFRVYYGDNFGTANGGSQYYSLSSVATGVLGVGLAGDNEGLFYWTSGAPSTDQTLYGYDTTASGGSGQQYTISSGYDAASGGAGAYRVDGADTGVYAVTSETRDGQCTGYFANRDTIHQTELVYEPNTGIDIGDRHVALGFSDGGIIGLSSQEFPVARSAYATAAGQSYTLGNIGLDGYCVPTVGCITATANEFFVAGYTQDDAHLLVNRFTVGTSEGTLEGDYTGTSMAKMAYNQGGSEPILCYATNSSQSLSVRTWNGASWSGATQIYSGAQTIEALTVTEKPGSEWAVAFIDAADNTKLIETAGSVWGSDVTLWTEDVFGFAGVGLDYHSGGNIALSVERNSAPSGVYLGEGPNSGSVSWELVDNQTDVNDARSMYAFYHLPSPVVLYYYRITPNRNSRMHLVEYDGSQWNSTELPFHMHGSPVSATLDASENIVMCGYRESGDPQYAAIAILYN